MLTAALLWVPSRQGRRVLDTKDLRLVSLDPAEPGRTACGRLFWDDQRHVCLLRVFDLAPPPPGQTYQLWFVTGGGAKVSAGTFGVGSGGKGSLEAAVPPSLGPVAAAAVTNEPAGGSPQPTGRIRLAGKLE